MSGWFSPPPVVTSRHVADVPKELYCSEQSEWVLPSTQKTPAIFIEGVTSDKQGNLYMVDIPFGRILRYALRTGEWKEICKYDGEPNGLALRADGTLVIADYKQGIVSRITIADVYRNTPIASTLQVSDEQLSLDPKTGIISPVLTRRNLERFKGPNDIIVASNGDIYFTDQGQTGMTDPTGSVYRLSPTGKLDQLLSNGPSPNGLVLSPDEKVLYVAMTRSNAVWRCPLLPDGSTSKVMQFFKALPDAAVTAFGSSGPDGLTVDASGNLFICHASLECIFVIDKRGLPVARIVAPESRARAHPDHPAHFNNCIFGSTDADRNTLYFVDSASGGLYAVDWHEKGGTPLRG